MFLCGDIWRQRRDNKCCTVRILVFLKFLIQNVVRFRKRTYDIRTRYLSIKPDTVWLLHINSTLYSLVQYRYRHHRFVLSSKHFAFPDHIITICVSGIENEHSCMWRFLTLHEAISLLVPIMHSKGRSDQQRRGDINRHLWLDNSTQPFGNTRETGGKRIKTIPFSPGSERCFFFPKKQPSFCRNFLAFLFCSTLSSLFYSRYRNAIPRRCCCRPNLLVQL